MQLIIDTSDEIMKIGLINSTGKWIKKNSWSSVHNESEVLLKKIESLLNSAKSSKKSIKRIVVCLGPGSYTALRVGISSANSIAYSLNVPIVGFKKDDEDQEFKEALLSKSGDKFHKVVLPVYKKEPHITIKKLDVKSRKMVKFN